MPRYKVNKVFQDARTNEIYSAGLVITLTEDRAKEIIKNLGADYLEIVPKDEGQIKDFVQAAVDEATAPLLEEIERLESELAAKELAASVNQFVAEEPSVDSTIEDFPKMISRGNYELSNGETFEGNKQAAVEAEKALEK